MPYLLRYKEGGKEKKVEVHDKDVVLGRAPDCGLVLTQPGISRHHCRIVQDQNGIHIQDLQSKNGTRVNNIYISTSKLTSGDTILVAESMIHYETMPEDGATGPDHPDSTTDRMVLLSEKKELHEEAGTIIRKANELHDIIAQYDKKKDTAQAQEGQAIDAGMIMRVIIQVAKDLIAVKSLDEIIEKLMNLIFENLPADRGFLMLKNETGVLEPKVVKHRAGSGQVETIEISQTIANKALNDKMAILTTDAQVDPRFSAGESIRFLGIKSAMCVPLFHKLKTIGIIYLDSPTSAAIFGPADLDLLTAMANFAAVGIEQAQLNEKIQQETSVRERLARYHSPSIVDRILKDIKGSKGGEFHLSAEEREVSVMFADIVGFTPLSEQLAPNRIAELLNEYFSEMTEIIFHYEGTLDKYIGDAIMAVFGAPNRMKDHPLRAVCTALEMLERLKNLNARRAPEDQFTIRIGINTGRAIAGDIGSIRRMEYTVLGNTVNLASRIESSASKPNQVVIGESTYRAVKDYFVIESLGAAQLKGISEKAQVYRVLGLKPEHHTFK